MANKFKSGIISAVTPTGKNPVNTNNSIEYQDHNYSAPAFAFPRQDGTRYDIIVEDGDTIRQNEYSTNGTLVASVLHRLNNMDSFELGQDPRAASQAKILEDAVRFTHANGGSIELQSTGKETKHNGQTNARPITNLYLNSSDGERVSFNKLSAEQGWSLVPPSTRKLPDNDPYASYTSIWEADQVAHNNGKGVYSHENLAMTKALEITKKQKGKLPISMNSKIGKERYDLSDIKNKDKVKIGDVWLDIPPTHISINQLRSSYNVPLLGFESKPITASLTNRIIIKMNLVFSGAEAINIELGRLLAQFRYVPINIIRSRDLFEKLGPEATWLKTAYENTGTYCVPVTMDNYTIYTLEGHPGSIGCSIQCSLFNFAAYFGADPNERLAYYKFDSTRYEIENDRIILKENVEEKSLFDVTYDLEDSIHPYNFVIEEKLSREFKYGVKLKQGGDPSTIAIAKINRKSTEKESQLGGSKEKAKIEDLLTDIILGDDRKGIFTIDIASSISASFSNNFAWQPLIGYAQPIAQYIGPGDTQISINIKTNDDKNVASYLKTYAERIDPSFYGYYDDRYYVDAELLNFLDCNVVSIQNVTVNNIETKPGWFDVNLMFNKSSYDYILAKGNEPQARDRYWGLGKMLDFLDIKEVKEQITKIEKITNDNKATAALYKIANPLGKDINGLDLSFKSAVNSALEFTDANWSKFAPSAKQVRKQNGLVTDIDQEATNKAKKDMAEKWSKSPLTRMSISQGKLKESEVKDTWQWRALKARDEVKQEMGSLVKNIKDNDAPSEALRLKLGYDNMSKLTKKTVEDILSEGNGGYASVYDGRTIAIDFDSKDKEEIDIVLNIIKNNLKRKVAGSEVLAENKLECKLLETKSGNARFVITRPYGNYYNNIPAAFKSSIAGVFKQLSEAQVKKIENLLKLAEDQNKPYAAHRYMSDIDDYICNNMFGSRTMGYWFACDGVKNFDKKISNIVTSLQRTQDIVQDYPAWKNVFVKDTYEGGIKSSINSFIDPGNPLSVMKAATYPEYKKHLSLYENGTMGIEKDIIQVERAGGYDPQFSEDKVFSNFSIQNFNRDYMKAGSELATFTSEQIKKEESKRVYKLAAGVDGNFKTTWSSNNFMRGVVIGDTLRSREGTTVNDVSNGVVGDSSLVSDPVSTSGEARAANGTVKSMNSNPRGVTLPGEAEVTTPTPATVSTNQPVFTPPTFGNYATAVNSADSAGVSTPITVEKRKAYDAEKAAELKQSTEDEMLKSFMHSQLPTFGIQNAFPTFKMYIIHDNTSEYKYKALDDYWDYRLVQDMMIIRDKNNPSHLLKARVLVDPRYSSVSARVNQRSDSRDQPLEGRQVSSDFQMQYNTIGGRDPIRQGMRIAIKVGYHTDPRAMDTVFIGTITSLSGTGEGGIYNLEGRGDGRELLVPPTIKDSSLYGDNFGDLINMMLRSNPNVIHFGKVYGSFLERFSREHQEWMMFLSQNWLSLGLFSGAALAPMFSNPITAVAGVTMGLTLGAWMGDANTAGRLVDKGMYNWDKQDFSGRLGVKWGDVKARLRGQIYNSEKAGYQVAKHIHQTMEFGHNPIDDNIWAEDIFAQGQASDVNIKVNNQKSIWDILVNIKRMYPGYALDVRPFGNRSTIYFGSPGGNYWRTDDPLIAMAPSLIQKDKLVNINDEGGYIAAREAAMKKLVPRDRFNNRTLSYEGCEAGENVAPFIPFVKHHSVSSAEDIILNGIRCTPERGWNSVVVSKENNSEPEEFVANEALYKSAIRRKFEVVDWTSNSRLRTQYAMGLLKEGVEKLYGGTLIIRGNPKIEPYDRIQIVDNINRMYGAIEVETVIHKYDSEMGFTTHIVPNMICSINDSSYLTSGDITKKVLVDKIRNIDLGSVLENGAMIGAGLLGVGFWPMMAAFSIYEIGKFIVNSGSSETLGAISKLSDERLSIEPGRRLDDVGWAMKAKEFSTNCNIDAVEVLAGLGIRSIYKMSKTGKLNIKGTIEKAKTAPGFIKNKAVDFTGLIKGLKSEMVTDLEGGTHGTSSAATKVTEKLKEQYKKVFKKAGSKATTEAGIIAESSYLSKIAKFGGPAGKTILGIAVFSLLEGIPMIFEAYAFKAATKNQIISIRPLWFKDSLLMQGLEGYKNSDVWMHTKDILINAGEVIKDGFKVVKNYDQQVLLDEMLDSRISTVGEAEAAGGTTAFGWGGTFGMGPTLQSKVQPLKEMELNGIKRLIAKYNPKYADCIFKWISEAAKNLNIPLDLLVATVYTESQFDEKVIGRKDPNDWGIMQINKKAHPEFFTKAKIPEGTKPSAVYMLASINYGARYLASKYNKMKKENPSAQEDEVYRRTYWGYNGGNIDAGYKNSEVVKNGNNFIANLNMIRHEFMAKG